MTNMQTKRLFIAIKIKPDPAFMKQYRGLKEALKHEPIKWVEEHNIHITLKFLGDTDLRIIPQIGEKLETVAHAVPSFSFKLDTLGIFGSRYQPRVIWIGINPYQPLVSLMQAVHDAMEPLGFEKDRQNLVPHLTLGRIKEIRDKQLFRETLDDLRTMASSSFQAQEMILFESILKKEGPEYHVIQTHSFQ